MARRDEEAYYRALDAMENLEVEDFEAAYRAIADGMTDAQRRMLLGHASARQRRLSMRSIGRFGYYDDYQTANIQYGTLGGRFVDYFAVKGLADRTQGIAVSGNERDDKGEFMWTLREQLAQALHNLGLIQLDSDNMLLRAATIDVAADPQCVEVPETTRRALSYARIGQGMYRAKLLNIWKGRCALTGCTVQEALVASHAKAWEQSTNRERLDPFNGLLLVASVDRLFDQGLISFDDDGVLLVRDELGEEDEIALGIEGCEALEQVDEKHRPYLRAHRRWHGYD